MRHRRQAFLAVAAVVSVAVIVAAHDVLLPFILAIVIAYVLTPLVAWAERRRLPRTVAVLLVYAVVLGSLALFARAVAPRIALEFRNLRGELPALSAEARTRWVPAITDRMRALGIAPAVPVEEPAPEPAATSAFVARPQPDGSLAIDVGTGVTVTETKSGWLVEAAHERKGEPFDPNRVIAEAVGKSFAYAQENSLEIARAVRDLFVAISRVIFVFFITLMLAAYLMLTRERIWAFFRSLVQSSHRAGFDALLTRVDRGLSGVVRGQLVICGINGCLSAVGFAIVGLKYWPVMALIAAVFSLVPIFGSIASAVPAVAVGLTQGLPTAGFVLLWIVGIHQLEANVLNPKIMGDAAKIHPVLVIFALLVGEHFFHAVGALLAVPVMSIAQSVFLHVREATAKDDEELAAGS
ncbi:MAG TPA: AI-2E family transporter [Polyangiaceae bacterium]|jgi:predicted PurR-regulated permease PerM